MVMKHANESFASNEDIKRSEEELERKEGAGATVAIDDDDEGLVVSDLSQLLSFADSCIKVVN